MWQYWPIIYAIVVFHLIYLNESLNMLEFEI